PAMQSLREPLNVYLDRLFKQSAYHESYLFRGLYFCGEAGVEPVPEALALPAATTQPVDILEPLHTTAIVAEQRKPVFLTDLFSKKIFGESTLAQPIRRIALSRNRTVLLAQVLSLLIVLLGGTGLALTYNRLSKQEDELYRFLSEEEGDLKKIEAYRAERKRSGNLSTDEWLNRREQLLESGETRLLTGMANMNARRFTSAFIPTSWFSRINERLESSIGVVFKYVIFESLRLDMTQRAKSLLRAHPDHSTSEVDLKTEDPTLTDETVASASHITPDFQLSVYVEELGNFRVNLERYNRLVGKDPDSLTTLSQLVTYLDHTPLPANFDKNNYLYQQAMFMATGREIDSTRFYKESSNRVGELVEDFYTASFNQKGVTYEHLDDIAETEALLSRPEYTWLSTYVFDPHSPFHGMTLSTGLGELRKALQDLRREEFMSREPADFEISRSLPLEQPRYQHFVRRVLVWDQDALRQAIALYGQYENFVETKSYERAEYLDNSVKQAARTRLKTKMSRLFRQARTYQALAPATDGSALRSSLITEIRSLQEAQPTLSRLLQISASLGIDGEMRGVLSNQVAYLLRGIYREFAAQQFYAMKRTDFSWWNGSQPVSFVAYDLASAEDLNAYLVLQRKNIAFLARDLAVPLLTFSAAQNI
ncbi:MAG TPA: type VI secretion protein IcmF/TssM N-terminal domain-containing protein, partial [Pyrinomonadaceae bacterium]